METKSQLMKLKKEVLVNRLLELKDKFDSADTMVGTFAADKEALEVKVNDEKQKNEKLTIRINEIKGDFEDMYDKWLMVATKNKKLLKVIKVLSLFLVLETIGIFCILM